MIGVLRDNGERNFILRCWWAGIKAHKTSAKEAMVPIGLLLYIFLFGVAGEGGDKK